MKQRLIAYTAAAAMGVIGASAYAVPYASAVRQTTGTTYEFVLNETASNVSIARTGDTTLNLGSLTPGRYTFDASAGYSIEVSNYAAEGWTRISDPGNIFLKFGRLNGLAVNRDASSPYFGSMYVAQANNVAAIASTANGTPARTMTDGVYALTADGKGVDPRNNFSVVTDPNSITAVGRPASWTDGSANSPWRLSLDDGGNVLVTDWSDANGGVKYVSADFQTGGLILGVQNGSPARQLVVGDPSSQVGGGALNSNHGSIVSKVYSTGTIGQDLVIYGIDEDLSATSGGIGAAPGITAIDAQSVWKWNVGAATGYVAPAELVINATQIAPTTTAQPNFLSTRGVVADLAYSGVHSKWYLSQLRADGDESGLTILTAGADGASTVEFSTLQWTIDNGYDGFPGEFDFITSDILRNINTVDVSDDGTELYLYKTLVEPDTVSGTGIANKNPLLGIQSNLKGSVLIVPLDANGIPVIQINDNGTPGDKTDDQISNWETIEITGNASARARAELDFDAAGNLYTTSNQSELLEIYSPGGNTKAVTTSTGDFSVSSIIAVAGDYNFDGRVDAADYTVWRDNPDANGGAGGYTTWANNYGAVASSASSTAVPEPTSLVVALGLIASGFGLRARR